jgi:hypothetical protein
MHQDGVRGVALDEERKISHRDLAHFQTMKAR